MATMLTTSRKSFKRLATKRLQYHSYVLRMWRQENCNSESANWRFALEDVLTGKIIGFTSLEALFFAVARQMGAEESQEIKG